MSTYPPLEQVDDARELYILDLASAALDPVINWAVQSSIDAANHGLHHGHEDYLRYLAGALAGMDSRVKFALCPVIEFAWGLSPAACELAAGSLAPLFVDEFTSDYKCSEVMAVRYFLKRLTGLAETLPLAWAVRVVLMLRKGDPRAAENECTTDNTEKTEAVDVTREE